MLLHDAVKAGILHRILTFIDCEWS